MSQRMRTLCPALLIAALLAPLLAPLLAGCASYDTSADGGSGHYPDTSTVGSNYERDLSEANRAADAVGR